MRSSLFRSLTSAVLVLTSATAGSAPAYALRPERAGVEEIRAALAGTEDLQPVEVIRPAAVDRLNLRAVVWDFDDTLWNGFPRDLEASEIGRWLGRDPGQVYGFMMDTNGLGWAERIAEMRKRGWEVPEDWKAAEDRFRQTLRNAIRDEKRTAPEYLVPGAAELLAAFHEAFFQASGKRRQAVATGGAADSRYQYADDLGIRKYFEFIRGGGHKGQTIADTLYNWWLTPNELAFISDSEPDIRTAKQAGVLAVGFAATPEIRRKLIAAGADVIIGRDYRAKELILDTLKLRRPAVTAAGAEEAATPANVQRVLDVLKPKIHDAKKLKEKSGRDWARDAEQVYGLLENDLPLLKTATGNSPRDQEIRQRAAAFFKRANDLLARAPKAGAEESQEIRMARVRYDSARLTLQSAEAAKAGEDVLGPLRAEMESAAGHLRSLGVAPEQPIRLDDLQIGRQLVSPDGQPYFVYQTGLLGAVLLPVVTQGEDAGISLEAEGVVKISSDEQMRGWRSPPAAGAEEAVVLERVKRLYALANVVLNSYSKRDPRPTPYEIYDFIRAFDFYEQQQGMNYSKKATLSFERGVPNLYWPGSKPQEGDPENRDFNEALALRIAAVPVILKELHGKVTLQGVKADSLSADAILADGDVKLDIVTNLFQASRSNQQTMISLSGKEDLLRQLTESLKKQIGLSAAGAEELSWLARFTPPAIVAAAVGIAVAGDIALEEKAVPAAKVTLEKRKVTVKDLPEDLLKGRKAAFLLIENDQNAEPGIWYFQGKVPAGPWHFEVKDGAVEVVSRVDLRPKKAWIFLVKDAAAEKALRAAIKKLPGHSGEEGDSYVAFTFGRRDLPALLGNDPLVRDTSLVAFRVEAARLIQWVPSSKAGVEEKVRVLQDKVDLVSVTTTPKNSTGEVARKQGEITKIVTRITVNDNSSVDYVHSSLDWALAIEHHRAVLRVTDITKAVAAARPDIFFAGLYALFPDSPTKPTAGAEEKLKPGDVHLLILDDEEMIRDMVRRFVVEPAARAAGIPLSQIHVVGTADEALRVIEEFKPQFGILDRNVKDPAGRTGIDVAREAVKAGGPLTRMVLAASLTTDAQVEEKDRELQPGGALAGFVKKPYKIDGPLLYYLRQFLKERVEPPAAGAEESQALVERAIASDQLGVPLREDGRTRTVVQVPASPEPMAMQLFVQAGLNQPEGLPETVWVRAYPAALAAAVRLLEINPPLKGAFFLLNSQVVNQQTAAAWLPATEHRAALVDPRVSGQDLGRLIQQIAALAALTEKNGQTFEINSISFVQTQQGTFAIIESA